MDGVTDPPFREIVDIYSHPDILFTEFVSSEAIVRQSKNILKSLLFHKSKTLIFAQIFGDNPNLMYKAAVVLSKLNFNGIDINMGCPDKTVVHRGAGAALINNPKLAQQCINSVKKAVDENYQITNKKIMVSVKTRIGFDSIITSSWINAILESKPDMITIHGRIAKKIFAGECHWDEIALAANIAKKYSIPVLGNGSVHTLQEAKDKINKFRLSGILIGRAALGNPWIFSDKLPSIQEKVKVMKHHCRLFLKYRPDLQLMPMRKHLAWYCKNFSNSAKIRNLITKVTTLEDLDKILSIISE
ncbi:MAG: tRNA-dihydrouridine synthase [Candidatus Woesearchaeota archaeon]